MAMLRYHRIRNWFPGEMKLSKNFWCNKDLKNNLRFFGNQRLKMFHIKCFLLHEIWSTSSEEVLQSKKSLISCDRLFFVIRSLSEMEMFGFDYDYTLAEYTEELQPLIYSMALQYMVQTMRSFSHLSSNFPFVLSSWIQFPCFEHLFSDIQVSYWRVSTTRIFPFVDSTMTQRRVTFWRWIFSTMYKLMLYTLDVDHWSILKSWKTMVALTYEVVENVSTNTPTKWQVQKVKLSFLFTVLDWNCNLPQPSTNDWSFLSCWNM